MDLFPVINKAYSMVSQEECHKTIIWGRNDKSEILSFAAQSSSSNVTNLHWYIIINLHRTPYPICIARGSDATGLDADVRDMICVG